MHTSGMSIVEVLKLFFCHGGSDPIKNCVGVLLLWEMLKYTPLFLSIFGTDEVWND